jgi:hypothetical protein
MRATFYKWFNDAKSPALILILGAIFLAGCATDRGSSQAKGEMDPVPISNYPRRQLDLVNPWDRPYFEYLTTQECNGIGTTRPKR